MSKKDRRILDAHGVRSKPPLTYEIIQQAAAQYFITADFNRNGGSLLAWRNLPIQTMASGMAWTVSPGTWTISVQ